MNPTVLRLTIFSKIKAGNVSSFQNVALLSEYICVNAVFDNDDNNNSPKLFVTY